jgi:hypothetical protein
MKLYIISYFNIAIQSPRRLCQSDMCKQAEQDNTVLKQI